MLLLKSLQTALNNLDGNAMLVEDRKYDEYYCTCCTNRVSEDAYNHKHKVCFKCFYDVTEDL